MAFDPGDEIVTISELKRELKIRSSSTIWGWVRKRHLPPPHHLLQRAVWRRSEIEAAKKRLLRPPRAA